jgi:hypothetical protein
MLRFQLTFNLFADDRVPPKELVQFFGFTFEDDVSFYRANVDANWQPVIHGEECTMPDLDDAIAAINRRLEGKIDFTIIDVYADPTNDPFMFYYMLAVASCVDNGPVQKIFSEDQLNQVARAAHLTPATGRWMRARFPLSILKDLGVPAV